MGGDGVDLFILWGIGTRYDLFGFQIERTSTTDQAAEYDTLYETFAEVA